METSNNFIPVDLLQVLHISQQENEKLKKEITILKRKIIELEDKLNINSSNSGLPTSKEIYRIEKENKTPTGKNPGAQVGHQHNGYKMQQADIKIEVMPDQDMCDCGGDLVLQEAHQIHQKIEIPPIKPVVTEYKLRQKICSKCKRRYKGKLENYRVLEKNAETITASLTGFFNNSKRDVQSILSQIFNLNISLGALSNCERRVSCRLENKYNELLSKAENSNHLHLDETGHQNRDKKAYAWVAANKDVTVFKFVGRRNTKALQSFLPAYKGKTITDRYAVYNIYNANGRQVCLAHLSRDFKRFAHSKDDELAQLGKVLCDIMHGIFRFYKLYKSGGMKSERYLHLIQKVRQAMLYYLESVADMDRCKQAGRVARNILKSFEMMWLFTKDQTIEPTNNLAERQIKHYVKYRKNSLFTWSERGDRFLERMISFYTTSRLQKLNPFKELLQIC